jgi:hypothetical protein
MTIIAALIFLYCCIIIGSKADRAMEKIMEESGEKPHPQPDQEQS